MEKQYVLVVNNEIVSTPAPLPTNYKNISNLFALSDQQLSDLSWSGNNEGFWLVTSDPLPTITIEQKIDTSYSLNIQNKTCHQTYTVVNVTPSEEEIRKNKLKSEIRMIRDQYLVITDFTQLPDVPFSVEAKAQFATFRQQLRDLPNVSDPTTITWPPIPTLVDINLPPFPPVPTYKI